MHKAQRIFPGDVVAVRSYVRPFLSITPNYDKSDRWFETDDQLLVLSVVNGSDKDEWYYVLNNKGILGWVHGNWIMKVLPTISHL